MMYLFFAFVLYMEFQNIYLENLKTLCRSAFCKLQIKVS